MNITPANEYDLTSLSTPMLHKLHEATKRTWQRRLETLLNQTESIHAIHDELRQRGEIK